MLNADCLPNLQTCMHFKPFKPKQTLNKAYLKEKIGRADIELFKEHFTDLLNKIDEKADEEHLKSLVSDFLKSTYYNKAQFQINKGLKQSKFILFSGSKPQKSLQVLKQLDSPEVIAVDTMQYHLEHNFSASIELIHQATYLFVNDQEYRFLQAQLQRNLFQAFPNLSYIFRKKGAAGIEVMQPGAIKHFDGLPVTAVINPINA